MYISVRTGQPNRPAFEALEPRVLLRGTLYVVNSLADSASPPDSGVPVNLLASLSPLQVSNLRTIPMA